MRNLSPEGVRMTGQHRRRAHQAELVVGPDETLEQPPAEEAGAAGQEDVLAAQALPEPLGVSQDVVEIGSREGWRSELRILVWVHSHASVRMSSGATPRARRSAANDFNITGGPER